MKRMKGLVTKFVIITVVLWMALVGYGVSIGNILLVSILLTAVLFVGDLFLLQRLGNFKTAAADLGLAFITIWGVGTFLFVQPMPLIMVSLSCALVIAFAELPLHLYIVEQVLTVKHAKSHTTHDHYSRREMLAEFGSEFEVKAHLRKDEE